MKPLGFFPTVSFPTFIKEGRKVKKCHSEILHLSQSELQVSPAEEMVTRRAALSR